MSRLIAATLLLATTTLAAPVYRSPIDVACAPDGTRLAASDHTAGKLVILDTARKVVQAEVALNGQPHTVAWRADGKAVYVSERGAGTVVEVDVAGGKSLRRFGVGRYPVGLAASKTRLIVANNGLSSVSIIDLASGKQAARIPGIYKAWGVAITPDGNTAVVGGLLPAGDARDATMACTISLIDVAGGKKTGIIKLPPGSINLRNIAVSPDGKWAYAVHSVGRFTLPTTQLERGWVMTHAMSIIDLGAKKHRATVLLDYLMEGGADPWGIRL
jgi:DNA-binding beta-propeller fold protein YncE